MKDAPDYRVWPPLSLAVPLAAGWLLSDKSPWPTDLPDRVRISVALALALGFVLINGTGYWMMHRARTGVLPGNAAVTILDTGPFRHSRNPLYVGLTLAYLAVGFWWDSAWTLALSALVVVGLHWGAILPEERYLEAKFGEAYLAYKRRVRRWV